MLVGLNDATWKYWESQSPGRDWAMPSHSVSAGITSASLTVSNRQAFNRPGLTQDNYHHWAEDYNSAQAYPATGGYEQCRYQGLAWRTFDTTSQTRPAPSTANLAGSAGGWYIASGQVADASLVNLTADGVPTKLPDDPSLTIYFEYAWHPPVGRGAFTVNYKTQPGIAFKVFAGGAGMTFTQSASDKAAGQFTLRYDGSGTYTGILAIDRANCTATLDSTFFLSGIPDFETGTPSADIGGPYMAADKLTDMAPFAGLRYVKPGPIERSAGDWTGTMTAANNTVAGGLRQWKYIADSAIRLGHKYIHLNVPDIADSTYVTAMATFFRDYPGLSSIELRPERSNEQWNTGIYQNAVDLVNRANALPVGDAAKGSAWLLHCREHNAMVAIWKSVFGADYATRVKPILAWQKSTSTTTWQQGLDFESTYLNVGNLGIAPYMDEGIGNWTASPNTSWGQDAVISAVGSSNQASFNTALSSYMTHDADYNVGLVKALFDFLPNYSVSKGLDKNAIQIHLYELGWFTTTSSTGWDTAFGAGAGTRAISYFDQWKRSAAGGAAFGYMLDQLAQKAPCSVDLFVYVGGTNTWGIMDGMGQETQEPYATIKTKALAYNV
jgi:hypothetical protein